MKWPKSITLIRHGQSAYNALRDTKRNDPEYERFRKAFNKDFRSPETLELAELMRARYALSVGDYETSLTEEGNKQALVTGQKLAATSSVPYVIFYSPYIRVRDTLQGIQKGWEALKAVRTIPDDRIREQEHGLSLLYNDWRLFQVFHPEQKLLHDLLGPYWYQYPQGESVSQVRDRIRLILTMLIREWAEKDVWLVTHHLTILSIRANLERLTPEEFIRLDKEEKPINCGVTRYRGNPLAGKDGRLELEFYNQRLY